MNSPHVSRRRLSPFQARATPPSPTFLIGSDRLIVDIDEAGFPATIMQDRHGENRPAPQPVRARSLGAEATLNTPARLPQVSNARQAMQQTSPTNQWTSLIQRVARLLGWHRRKGKQA